MNRVNIGSFVSLTLTAVVMAGAVAHLLELPAKMKLNGPEYLTVQQIYRGWALLGTVIYAALAYSGATHTRKPRNKQLDTATRALAAIARPLGVLACGRGGTTVLCSHRTRRFAARARSTLTTCPTR